MTAYFPNTQIKYFIYDSFLLGLKFFFIFKFKTILINNAVILKVYVKSVKAIIFYCVSLMLNFNGFLLIVFSLCMSNLTLKDSILVWICVANFILHAWLLTLKLLLLNKLTKEMFKIFRTCRINLKYITQMFYWIELYIKKFQLSKTIQFNINKKSNHLATTRGMYVSAKNHF